MTAANGVDDFSHLSPEELLLEAEKLVPMGEYAKAEALALAAREAFVSKGDTAREAEAIRFEILSRQGVEEQIEELPEIDLLAEIELSRFRTSGDRKAAAIMMYTVAEVNVHRPSKRLRVDADQLVQESLEVFNELGDEHWEARALLMLINVEYKQKASSAASMHKNADKALRIFKEAGDTKRQAMAIHAKSLAYMSEKNRTAAIQAAQEALSLYRKMGEIRFAVEELKTIALWRFAMPGNQLVIASRELIEALEMARKHLPAWHEASVLQQALKCLNQANNQREALKQAKLSLRRFEQLPDEDESMELQKAQLQIMIDELEGRRTNEGPEKFAGFKDGPKLNILLDIASTQLNNGNLQMAAAYSQAAMPLAEELGRADKQVKALHIIAQIQLRTGDKHRTIETAKIAQNIARANNDRAGEGQTWLVMALAHSFSKAFEKAQRCCWEAQAIFEEIGDEKREADVWHMVTELHMQTKQREAALQSAAKRLECLQRGENYKLQAAALGNIASIFMAMENYEEAERSALEMLRLSRMNVTYLNVEISAQLFLLQMQLQRYSQAGQEEESDYLAKATTAAEHAGMLASREMATIESKASVKYWQGEVLINTGQPDVALRAAQEAEALYKQCSEDDPEAEIRCQILQGACQGSLGYTDDAVKILEKAKGRAKEVGLKPSEKMAEDLIKQLKKRPAKAAKPAQQERAAPAAQPQAAAKSTTLSAGLDKGMVRAKILTHVENVMAGEGTADGDTPLMDAGLDSLSAIDLQNLIAQDFPFGGSSNTLLFDYPTVRELTAYIVEQSQVAGL
eukprot:TRINITY_DN11542_c0_g2_i1.p1 TRINITY_DN11542_c0_g2~~TRINITY_DN11542_c0_g2_i1.p1  ORF type:complete len:802 (-),score=215.63 TRINITY_DN11542_c0_g2_i1:278-2683(-)